MLEGGRGWGVIKMNNLLSLAIVNDTFRLVRVCVHVCGWVGGGGGGEEAS